MGDSLFDPEKRRNPWDWRAHLRGFPGRLAFVLTLIAIIKLVDVLFFKMGPIPLDFYDHIRRDDRVLNVSGEVSDIRVITASHRPSFSIPDTHNFSTTTFLEIVGQKGASLFEVTWGEKEKVVRIAEVKRLDSLPEWVKPD